MCEKERERKRPDLPPPHNPAPRFPSVGLGTPASSLHRASYRALLAGLRKANQDLERDIQYTLTCVSDDAVVMAHLRGESHPTDPELLALLDRVRQYEDTWQASETPWDRVGGNPDYHQNIRIVWKLDAYSAAVSKARELALAGNANAEQVGGWVGGLGGFAP